ncbi:MAG: phosphoserine phosphatase SerB [Alphaproteobacteria bacterium]|nr:phosphoserine phosphatase SerB [Alphaproteobacteria bacterium]
MALTEEHIAKVREAVIHAGGHVQDHVWLEQGEAADLHISYITEASLTKTVHEALLDLPVDAICQPEETRRKAMFISDMDSTIITIECIDELADVAGIKPQVADITERAMRGELDFEAALKERVGLLKGLPEGALAEVYESRLTFMPGAAELVGTMRANGAHCVLVSGGFEFFTSRVAGELGFHEQRGNRLGVLDGLLTGEVVPPILDKNAKLEALMEIASSRNLTLANTLAAGDGANDLPMLMASGLGVAYHAKPAVRAAAKAQINHTNLFALLFAQGYRRTEFKNFAS